MDVNDMATGPGRRRKLRIAGRPDQGRSQTLVLLEEPGEPVQVHYVGTLMPHLLVNCPHCAKEPLDTKPMWYMGALVLDWNELAIAEFNERCFSDMQTAAIANPLIPPQVKVKQVFTLPDGTTRELLVSEPATLGLATDAVLRDLNPSRFAGMKVVVSRGNFPRAPRVVRFLGRTESVMAWRYDTRLELCYTWDIPVRPRLRKAEGE